MATDEKTIKSYFTSAGSNLATRIQAGETKITFTKAVASDADHFSDSADTINQLTALDSVKQTADIGAVLILNKNTVQVSIDFNQNEITEDYQLRTIGLYGKSDDGDEILYSVTPLQYPQYMYADTSGSTLTINLDTAVGQSANVTVVVSPAGSVTSAQLTAQLQSYYTGEQVDKKIAGIPKPDLTPYTKTVDVNQQLDKKVNVTDMRKPASDVAGIEEVNAKADDSKVAHLSGANNFDTVPTVNNNALLLASSLPSDLARTGSDQEFTGKNTFDTAPIDKKTGNPYITKDGVPAVSSTLADTTKDANFTGKLQKSGIDVATKSDVTNAVNTATTNMADFTKATNFTAGLQSGGIDVATAADLKSVEASAWHQLDVNINISKTRYLCVGWILYREIDSSTLEITGNVAPNSTEGNTGPLAFPIFQLTNYKTLSSSTVGLQVNNQSSSQMPVTFNGNTAYLNMGGIALFGSSINGGWCSIFNNLRDVQRIGPATVSFTK